jgi:uncharacterized protein YndB with AHSA1/START domain
MTRNDDKIEKVVELTAPVSRVWQALTDSEEFGQWFQVRLDQPFRPGAASTGTMTYPGTEGQAWVAHVERIEPESLFSMRWNLYDPDPDDDEKTQATTLVEFRLKPTSAGTRLTITESGFSKLPDRLRLEAMPRNAGGWDLQAENIARYVRRPNRIR